MSAKDMLAKSGVNLLSQVQDMERRIELLERRAMGIPSPESIVMTFIEEQTAASSATLDLILPGGYRYYSLILRNLKPATDAVDLWLRMSTDGGVTFLTTTTYGYHAQASSSSAATYSGVNSAGAAQIVLCGSGAVGNASNESVNGLVELWNMESAANKKSVTYHMVFHQTAGNPVHVSGSGDQDTTSAVNAARLMFSSGNVASGTVTLYGIV